jgi:hypothetical protein
METELPQRPDTGPSRGGAKPTWATPLPDNELLKYQKRAGTAMTLVLVGLIVPLCMFIGWIMGLTVIGKIPHHVKGKTQAQVAVFLPVGLFVLVLVVVAASSGS